MDALKQVYPDAEFFKFGDSEALCQHLLALIRTGKKTATCGALHEFQTAGEVLPIVGRCDVALNWDGSAALVIRTLEVTIQRFCNVDTGFALAEGENDSLQGWRDDHRQFFERNGGWTEDMELVCERFEVVEVINPKLVTTKQDDHSQGSL